MKFVLLALLAVVCVANANVYSQLLQRHLLKTKHTAVFDASPPVIACQACNDAMKFFNDMLQSPFIESSLKQLMYTECSKMPSPYGQYCNATVDVGFTDILAFITDMDGHLCTDVVHCTTNIQSSNVFDQKTICSAFEQISAHLPQFVSQLSHVCQKIPESKQKQICEQLFVADTPILVRVAEKVLQSVVAGQCRLSNTYEGRSSVKSVGCEACKDAIDVLNTLLKSSLVEDALQSVLLELCKVLPSKYSSGCTSTVTQFIDVIMNFITDMTPHVCDLISNCQTFALHALTKQTKGTKRTKESSVCGVFQEIYNELPKLLADAEQICDKIPDANLSAGCHDFFKNDFQDVIKMAQGVVQKLASEIPFLHCKVSVVSSVVPGSQPKSVGCTACKDLVSVLNTLLKSGLVEGSLEDLLKDLCTKLPAPYNAGCSSTVDQFMDQILSFITDMTNDICSSGFGCTTKKLTRESDICEVFDEIINKMPTFAKEAEGVCDKIPDQTLATGCHQFFQTQQQWVINMGDQMVEWLANEIPFVHCTFSTSTPASVALRG